MDNERKQLWYILECAGVCVIFAALYAIGGSGDFGGLKWLRRFLAPGLFCIWAGVRSFDWHYAVQIPFMIGGLTLPYGSDDVLEKVILRGVFGLANGISSSTANLIHKRYFLTLFQVVLVTLVSIGAGVFNPFDNAMIEQFIIGFIIIFIPAMTVKRRI